MPSFSDAKAIVGYAENAIRRVPGLNDIHRMSAWLSRCAAFAASSGVDPVQARATAVAIGNQLLILSPDEHLLCGSGISRMGGLCLTIHSS